MDVEKTADEAINNLADILYGKQGPSVDLTPVFNDYENREDIRNVKCEIQKIQSLSEDVDKAIGDIIYMYISYGAFAEGDKKLKDSESLLLTLNRILGNNIDRNIIACINSNISIAIDSLQDIDILCLDKGKSKLIIHLCKRTKNDISAPSLCCFN